MGWQTHSASERGDGERGEPARAPEKGGSPPPRHLLQTRGKGRAGAPMAGSVLPPAPIPTGGPRHSLPNSVPHPAPMPVPTGGPRETPRPGPPGAVPARPGVSTYRRPAGASPPLPGHLEGAGTRRRRRRARGGRGGAALGHGPRPSLLTPPLPPDPAPPQVRPRQQLREPARARAWGHCVPHGIGDTVWP